MKTIQRFAAMAAFILTATDVYALSYECKVNGELIYQPHPCDGVTYSENLTQTSRYGGTNVSLSDLLAVGGATESQRNAEKRTERRGKTATKGSKNHR